MIALNDDLFRVDGRKERLNHEKHGIVFREAVQIFEDPLCRFALDRIVDGEERWHAVGVTENQVLLLVVHTSRHEITGDEIVRIISARRAIRKERQAHEA